MIHHFEQMPVEPVGPTGSLRVRHILSGDGEMNGKARVLALCTLDAGAAVPLHRHEGESETWFFLDGIGEFSDDGVPAPVQKGDAAHLFPGHSHALRNVGDMPLQYIALVLYQ